MNRFRLIASTVLLASMASLAVAQTTSGTSAMPCKPGTSCAPGTAANGTMPMPPAGPMGGKMGEMHPGMSGMGPGMGGMKPDMATTPGAATTDAGPPATTAAPK